MFAEKITDVSPRIPEPSRDWEPCRRTRNGKACGERLDFSTDGMGRLVPQCPVCDWGWRPSGDYDAFRVRVRDAEATRARLLKNQGFYQTEPKPCAKCGRGFQPPPRSASSRYCSDSCSKQARAERYRAKRAAWAHDGRCVICSRENDTAGRSCSKCIRRVGARRAGALVRIRDERRARDLAP